jgi:hypothetical protein
MKAMKAMNYLFLTTLGLLPFTSCNKDEVSLQEEEKKIIITESRTIEVNNASTINSRVYSGFGVFLEGTDSTPYPGDFDEVESGSYKYRLRLQRDGNLCVYRLIRNNSLVYEETSAIWCLRNYSLPLGLYRLCNQSDGNLVIYSGGGTIAANGIPTGLNIQPPYSFPQITAIWNTGTQDFSFSDQEQYLNYFGYYTKTFFGGQKFYIRLSLTRIRKDGTQYERASIFDIRVQ